MTTTQCRCDVRFRSPGRSRIARLCSRLAAVAATVLVLLATVGAAGAQETGGAISGTILDQQKATLPGVTVTLRNESTNAELTTVTNDQGAFVHPFVPIGRYTLTATLQGFSTAKRGDVEVRVGDRLTIDLTLTVGNLTEEVVVSGGTPLLETSNAMRGQVIAREQVQDLPLLGRNPFSLAQLSPGVQYTPALASRSNRPFDNGGMDNFQITDAASRTSSCWTACRTRGPKPTSRTTSASCHRRTRRRSSACKRASTTPSTAAPAAAS